MKRSRVNTTVDAELLGDARKLRKGTTDAAILHEALRAFLARYRAADVDASYAAYDEHPIDEPDEWGDLASWRQAAAATGETSGRLTLGSHAPLSPGGTP